jgi:hypothetical protein
MIVTDGRGNAVAQKARWAQNELAAYVDADVTRAASGGGSDGESSEWDSEWGDRPGGGGAGMPPWRGGGPPEIVLAELKPRRPSTAGPYTCFRSS